ncbi:prophage tail fiber N-terminal domain-containing protein [Yersinia rohdei]|uniref:Putative phage tail protein n=1 Tax=Yersinia rohdei TaxID=29485 RepID=A0A0U1HX28_YERRO|nr:prophage tail fiber N-terminal domain-containing protein [Yersinia rohdei]MDN0094048.1 prophage tail fiber N-terminal domain-containing protein [Yersinia rohdei]CQI96136.1 putative phage tail protein [Yersinia rohdei]
MSVTVSGIIINPVGEPVANAQITLTAIANSLNVLNAFSATVRTDSAGAYRIQLEEGSYSITVAANGRSLVYGAITLDNTTGPSTLNQLLKQQIMESELTPDVILYFRQIQQQVANDLATIIVLESSATGSAESAGQSRDEARQYAANLAEAVAVAIGYRNEAGISASAASLSQNNAAASETNAKASEEAALGSEDNALIYRNAAQSAAETAADDASTIAADLTAEKIKLQVKTDADRAVDARTASEQIKGSVDNTALQITQQHNEALQAASEAESSKNSAALSAENAQGSATAAGGAKEAAANSAETAQQNAETTTADRGEVKGFRDEAEGFANQARESASSIDIPALQTEIDQKLDKSGGTMTGELTLHGDATAGLEAVTLDQLKRMGGLPIGFVSWCTMRSKIRAGEAPLDGQILTRSLFPSFFAELAAGNHPVVSDADWLADPLKRASFTLGDGSTTFRLADLNGKSPGSIGRLFLGGDGTNSAGTNGLIQLSENKAHIHAVTDPGHAHVKAIGYRRSGTTYTDENYWGRVESDLAVDGNLYTRTAPTGISINSTGGTEARPNNATGCYTIKLAGAALNSGQVDALALASSIAALATRVTTVEGIAAISFTTAQMTTTVWEKLTVGGGWTGEFWYRRVLGSLQIHCDLVAPGPANGATLTVLPVGYRPKVNATLVPWAPRDASAMPMRLLIQSNTGTVLIGNLGSAGPISGEFFVPFE